jgi:SAM-dependent methyltransferase
VDHATITDEVKRFYEAHPYPPPVGDLAGYRARWQDRGRRRADHHLHWPARPFREDPSVLIAGCGTSQAAKHALRWPAAQITAIDLSATGVRHTEALKRAFGLQNLEVRRLALEEVGRLGLRFDQIVCTGVLHHLADPPAGLRALRDVLAPEGALHLMVYAPYGRTGVYMLQEFFRRLGVTAGPDLREGMRDIVAALEALPPGHPLGTLLRTAPDFRDEAALADALLNPQDRAYAVPELLALIDGAGLAFGRWVRQAPYSARCGAVARIPLADRLARLSPPDEAAAVELFRGTMVRHSVIVHHAEGAGARRPIGLSGPAWSRFVPVRMADTIEVGERLPPGAAAVLINRGHTYTDLFLPIDAREKRLLDAIDGERTVDDLARRAGGTSLEETRAFLERLHAYDQVVFDASAAAAV